MPASDGQGRDVLRRVGHALHLDRRHDASAEAEVGVAPAAPAAEAAPATMHKGAMVVVKLFVEGDDAPAHDFTETATAAARAIIAAGMTAGATPLTVTVKDVAVDDDSADADQ